MVADATQGQIVRYSPAVGSMAATETLVWKYSGTGPAHPDGLSRDGNGNLYIVTSKLNDSTGNAVWVLPANPLSPTGFAAAPLLVDASFGSAKGVKTLMETLIAPTSGPGWSGGDLLVLVGNGSSSGSQNNTNDADVFVYHATTTLARALAGTAAAGPDLVLLNPSQFPPGEFPTGFDAWPPGASGSSATILIATNMGRVLDYSFGAGLTPSYTVFASGLGSGFNKLRVGAQMGLPVVFVTQSTTSGGRILEFGAAGGAPIGIVTTGVNNPDGIAATH